MPRPYIVPAEEIASKESRAIKLALQGVSAAENLAYGRKIFLAIKHLHAHGVPIVLATRNSEANAWFFLREVACVPTPWINKVLSVHDAESKRGKKSKVQKWELVEEYFASQNWARHRASSAGAAAATKEHSSPRVTRAVFIDDSSID